MYIRSLTPSHKYKDFTSIQQVLDLVDTRLSLISIQVSDYLYILHLGHIAIEQCGFNSDVSGGWTTEYYIDVNGGLGGYWVCVAMHPADVPLNIICTLIICYADSECILGL